MDDRQVSLSNYRITKSQSDLNAAKILLKNKLYSQAINRSYYSIFHAVRALLAFDKYDSKKHSGIISYFNENYIKTGLIEKEYSVMLMSAERIRNESDYDDMFIATKEQAEQQIEKAEKFSIRIKEFLSRRNISGGL